MNSRVQRLLKAHPLSVPFDEHLDTYGIVPTSGRGQGVEVPYYGAGFFVSTGWMVNECMPRFNAEHWQDVQSFLMSHEELGPQFYFRFHPDSEGRFVVILRTNRAFTLAEYNETQEWLRHRDEHFDTLCKVMKLTDADIVRIKPNFKWHIIAPIMQIPRGLVLGPEVSAIPSDDNASEVQNVTETEETV